ncbi:MAG: LLM class F420-dependent oxidoreductase, partial [Actinomycetota bacterium]
EVLDRWCAEVGRNPREIERTVALAPTEADKIAEFAEAGADHVIFMVGNPYDLGFLEMVLAAR